MANLHKTGSLHPRWKHTADLPLDDFEAVEIAILDMQMGDDGKDFNWYTNSGGRSEPTLLYHGPAQFQLYRLTLTMDDVAGSVGQFRPARFTVEEKRLGDQWIGKGNMIRITSAPGNDWLRSYEFIIASGLSAQLAFRRVFEAEVNLAAQVPPYAPPEVP